MHRITGGAVLVLLLLGCTPGWQRVELAPEQVLPVRQHAQIWSKGTFQRLHAIRLVGDTLVGVPSDRPPECDECQIVVPWAQVDSVWLGEPEAAFFQSLGVVAAVGLGLFAVMIIRADDL